LIIFVNQSQVILKQNVKSNLHPSNKSKNITMKMKQWQMLKMKNQNKITNYLAINILKRA